MKNRENNNTDDNTLILFIFIIVLILVFSFLYGKYKLEVHSILLKLSTIEMLPFFFLEEPRDLVGFIQHTSVEKFTDLQMGIILSTAGKYVSIIGIPFMLYFSCKGFRSNILDNFRFKITAQKLIEFNAQHIPALRPLLDKNLLTESLDSGPWATAQQPLQWAVAHEVLLLPDNIPVDSSKSIEAHKRLTLQESGIPIENSPCLQINEPIKHGLLLSLDYEKTKSLFDTQIGHSLENMQAHEKALAAAFMAFGFGHKDKASALFDHYSTTYSENLDFSNSAEVYEEYITHEKVQKIVALHGKYTRCFLVALIEFARQKGVICCSQFIWLRPYDRVLWYSLNQVGGKASWAEASGVWNHYILEEALGEAQEEIDSQGAVKALQYALEMEGWLPEDLTKEKPMPLLEPESKESRNQKIRNGL